MKTAISIPDELFEQVTRAAAALGVSRSAFFAQAAAHYVEELAKESVTAQIDAVLERVGDDDSWDDAVAAGRRMLADDSEDW